MLTAARRGLAGAALALLLVLGAVGPAGAALRGGPDVECPAGQNDCSIWDDDPGLPGGPGGGGTGGDTGGSTGGGGSTDGPAAKCQWNGRALPCHDDLLGWFNNADGCYYKLAEPQPSVVEGKQWYVKTCNGGDLGAQETVLLDAAPGGFEAPPDPAELARQALASIELLPPRLKVAPRRGKGPGLVGLPVWMWASPGPNYFGPLHASASDRGLTVALSATVDRIVWDMDNGDTVTCTGPGTPYVVDGPRAGLTSPDCGYDQGYAQARTYRIRATTHWTVSWEGGGQSDSFPLTRTSNVVPIEIDELQVVTG
ncbi:hypothetical protein [Micromonospora siamensis]|uniref:ATP/GTP-binding protein n=1 Tax=Micromonospora siamensis TaxID=299152 RepID=A0A1C5H0H0_9ACTN|nr:hypothetical protein GA0074704_0839 [Micromonospora siamensis]